VPGHGQVRLGALLSRISYPAARSRARKRAIAVPMIASAPPKMSVPHQAQTRDDGSSYQVHVVAGICTRGTSSAVDPDSIIRPERARCDLTITLVALKIGPHLNSCRMRRRIDRKRFYDNTNVKYHRNTRNSRGAGRMLQWLHIKSDKPFWEF